MTDRWQDIGSGAAPADKRGDELDLRAIWTALKRRKRWILWPTLAVLALTTVAVNLIPARYTGEARLLMENRDSYFTRPGQEREQSGQAAFDPEAIQSQIQIIMSSDLGRKAIKRLGLVGNPEFDPAVSGLGVFSRFLTMIGLMKPATDRSIEDRVLDVYNQHILVYPVGRSRVVAVEFNSKDPELAAKGANVIAELYVDELSNAKKDTARSAGDWLSTTIDQLRRRVADAEAKTEEYRARMGLLVGSNNTTLAQQQLAEQTTQLTAAKAQLAETQAKARMIRDMLRNNRIFEISDVVNNDLIRRMLEQRSNLRTQLALESRNLLPEHPQIKALNAQLADIENQIRLAADRQVRALENDIQVSASRVEALQSALDQQKKTAAGANEAEVQLRAYEREARTLREQLESYLAKYREAVSRDSENALPGDARIIQRASVPLQPSFPRKIPTILIATLASLIMSTAGVIARELMASRRAVEEEPRELPVSPEPDPHMSFERSEKPAQPAKVAAAGFGDPSITHAAPGETFAALTNRIAQAKARDGAIRLIISHIGVGTEGVAVGLARTLAANSRTILVSCTPEAAASQDEASGDAGLSDLLDGDVSFMEVIHREPASRLHVMGPGGHRLDEVEGVEHTLPLVLEALGETYDTVVIDIPADLPSSIVRLIGEQSDVAVLAGPGPDPTDEIMDAFEALRLEAGIEPFVLLVGQELPEHADDDGGLVAA